LVNIYSLYLKRYQATARKHPYIMKE